MTELREHCGVIVIDTSEGGERPASLPELGLQVPVPVVVLRASCASSSNSAGARRPGAPGPTSSGAHEGTVSWRDGCILLSAKQLGVSAGENEQLWMVLYEQEGIQHALCAPQLLVRYEGQSKLECPTLAECASLVASQKPAATKPLAKALHSVAQPWHRLCIKKAIGKLLHRPGANCGTSSSSNSSSRSSSRGAAAHVSRRQLHALALVPGGPQPVAEGLLPDIIVARLSGSHRRASGTTSTPHEASGSGGGSSAAHRPAASALGHGAAEGAAPGHAAHDHHHPASSSHSDEQQHEKLRALACSRGPGPVGEGAMPGSSTSNSSASNIVHSSGGGGGGGAAQPTPLTAAAPGAACAPAPAAAPAAAAHTQNMPLAAVASASAAAAAGSAGSPASSASGLASHASHSVGGFASGGLGSGGGANSAAALSDSRASRGSLRLHDMVMEDAGAEAEQARRAVMQAHRGEEVEQLALSGMLPRVPSREQSPLSHGAGSTPSGPGSTLELPHDQGGGLWVALPDAAQLSALARGYSPQQGSSPTRQEEQQQQQGGQGAAASLLPPQQRQQHAQGQTSPHAEAVFADLHQRHAGAQVQAEAHKSHWFELPPAPVGGRHGSNSRGSAGASPAHPHPEGSPHSERLNNTGAHLCSQMAVTIGSVLPSHHSLDHSTASSPGQQRHSGHHMSLSPGKSTCSDTGNALGSNSGVFLSHGAMHSLSGGARGPGYPVPHAAPRLEDLHAGYSAGLHPHNTHPHGAMQRLHAEAAAAGLGIYGAHHGHHGHGHGHHHGVHRTSASHRNNALQLEEVKEEPSPRVSEVYQVSSGNVKQSGDGSSHEGQRSEDAHSRQGAGGSRGPSGSQLRDEDVGRASRPSVFSFHSVGGNCRPTPALNTSPTASQPGQPTPPPPSQQQLQQQQQQHLTALQQLQGLCSPNSRSMPSLLRLLHNGLQINSMTSNAVAGMDSAPDSNASNILRRLSGRLSGSHAMDPYGIQGWGPAGSGVVTPRAAHAAEAAGLWLGASEAAQAGQGSGIAAAQQQQQQQQQAPASGSLLAAYEPLVAALLDLEPAAEDGSASTPRHNANNASNPLFDGTYGGHGSGGAGLVAESGASTPRLLRLSGRIMPSMTGGSASYAQAEAQVPDMPQLGTQEQEEALAMYLLLLQDLGVLPDRLLSIMGSSGLPDHPASSSALHQPSGPAAGSTPAPRPTSGVSTGTNVQGGPGSDPSNASAMLMRLTGRVMPSGNYALTGAGGIVERADSSYVETLGAQARAASRPQSAHSPPPPLPPPLPDHAAAADPESLCVYATPPQPTFPLAGAAAAGTAPAAVQQAAGSVAGMGAQPGFPAVAMEPGVTDLLLAVQADLSQLPDRLLGMLNAAQQQGFASSTGGPTSTAGQSSITLALMRESISSQAGFMRMDARLMTGSCTGSVPPSGSYAVFGATGAGGGSTYMGGHHHSTELTPDALFSEDSLPTARPPFVPGSVAAGAADVGAGGGAAAAGAADENMMRLLQAVCDDLGRLPSRLATKLGGATTGPNPLDSAQSCGTPADASAPLFRLQRLEGRVAPSGAQTPFAPAYGAAAAAAGGGAVAAASGHGVRSGGSSFNGSALGMPDTALLLQLVQEDLARLPDRLGAANPLGLNAAGSLSLALPPHMRTAGSRFESLDQAQDNTPIGSAKHLMRLDARFMQSFTGPSGAPSGLLLQRPTSPGPAASSAGPSGLGLAQQPVTPLTPPAFSALDNLDLLKLIQADLSGLPDRLQLRNVDHGGGDYTGGAPQSPRAMDAAGRARLSLAAAGGGTWTPGEPRGIDMLRRSVGRVLPSGAATPCYGQRARSYMQIGSRASNSQVEADLLSNERSRVGGGSRPCSTPTSISNSHPTEGAGAGTQQDAVQQAWKFAGMGSNTSNTSCEEPGASLLAGGGPQQAGQGGLATQHSASSAGLTYNHSHHGSVDPKKLALILQLLAEDASRLMQRLEGAVSVGGQGGGGAAAVAALGAGAGAGGAGPGSRKPASNNNNPALSNADLLYMRAASGRSDSPPDAHSRLLPASEVQSSPPPPPPPQPQQHQPPYGSAASGTGPTGQGQGYGRGVSPPSGHQLLRLEGRVQPSGQLPILSPGVVAAGSGGAGPTSAPAGAARGAAAPGGPRSDMLGTLDSHAIMDLLYEDLFSLPARLAAALASASSSARPESSGTGWASGHQTYVPAHTAGAHYGHAHSMGSASAAALQGMGRPPAGKPGGGAGAGLGPGQGNAHANRYSAAWHQLGLAPGSGSSIGPQQQHAGLSGQHAHLGANALRLNSLVSAGGGPGGQGQEGVDSTHALLRMDARAQLQSVPNLASVQANLSAAGATGGHVEDMGHLLGSFGEPPAAFNAPQPPPQPPASNARAGGTGGQQPHDTLLSSNLNLLLERAQVPNGACKHGNASTGTDRSSLAAVGAGAMKEMAELQARLAQAAMTQVAAAAAAAGSSQQQSLAGNALLEHVASLSGGPTASQHGAGSNNTVPPGHALIPIDSPVMVASFEDPGHRAQSHAQDVALHQGGLGSAQAEGHGQGQAQEGTEGETEEEFVTACEQSHSHGNTHSHSGHVSHHTHAHEDDAGRFAGFLTPKKGSSAQPLEPVPGPHAAATAAGPAASEARPAAAHPAPLAAAALQPEQGQGGQGQGRQNVAASAPVPVKPQFSAAAFQMARERGEAASRSSPTGTCLPWDQALAACEEVDLGMPGAQQASPESGLMILTRVSGPLGGTSGNLSNGNTPGSVSKELCNESLLAESPPAAAAQSPLASEMAQQQQFQQAQEDAPSLQPGAQAAPPPHARAALAAAALGIQSKGPSARVTGSGSTAEGQSSAAVGAAGAISDGSPESGVAFPAAAAGRPPGSFGPPPLTPAASALAALVAEQEAESAARRAGANGPNRGSFEEWIPEVSMQAMQAAFGSNVDIMSESTARILSQRLQVMAQHGVGSRDNGRSSSTAAVVMVVANSGTVETVGSTGPSLGLGLGAHAGLAASCAQGLKGTSSGIHSGLQEADLKPDESGTGSGPSTAMLIHALQQESDAGGSPGLMRLSGSDNGGGQGGSPSASRRGSMQAGGSPSNKSVPSRLHQLMAQQQVRPKGQEGQEPEGQGQQPLALLNDQEGGAIAVSALPPPPLLPAQQQQQPASPPPQTPAAAVTASASNTGGTGGSVASNGVSSAATTPTYPLPQGYADRLLAGAGSGPGFNRSNWSSANSLHGMGSMTESVASLELRRLSGRVVDEEAFLASLAASRGYTPDTYHPAASPLGMVVGYSSGFGQPPDSYNSNIVDSTGGNAVGLGGAGPAAAGSHAGGEFPMQRQQAHGAPGVPVRPSDGAGSDASHAEGSNQAVALTSQVLQAEGDLQPVRKRAVALPLHAGDASSMAPPVPLMKASASCGGPGLRFESLPVVQGPLVSGPAVATAKAAPGAAGGGLGGVGVVASTSAAAGVHTTAVGGGGVAPAPAKRGPCEGATLLSPALHRLLASHEAVTSLSPGERHASTQPQVHVPLESPSALMAGSGGEGREQPRQQQHSSPGAKGDGLGWKAGGRAVLDDSKGSWGQSSGPHMPPH